MRFLKTFYLGLLFSLTLGLFCSELPESFSLNDDTTNDFVETSGAAIVRDTQEVRKDPERRVRISSTVEPVPQFPAIDRAELTRQAGPDLLRLFSIQRK